MGGHSLAKRQRDWARRARQTLVESLGGRCAKCGTTQALQLDVIIPVETLDHHRIEWSWRISFYRQQYEAGNLQLLCQHDNAVKGNNPGW